MGSFNYTGAFSNLPIRWGSKIVCLIGFEKKNISATEANEFAPGHSFIPIALPIYGEYNSYGGIENCVEDANTKYVCEFFGKDTIDEVIDSIDSNEGGEDIIRKIIEYNYASYEYELMSHEMYLYCSNLEDKGILTFNDTMCVRHPVDYLLKDSTYFNSVDDVIEFRKKMIYNEVKQYRLVVQFEHKFVFDELLKLGRSTVLKNNFWQIPVQFLYDLGYNLVETLEKENSYDRLVFEHPNGKKIVKNCYLYEYGHERDYNFMLSTLEDVVKYTGVDVPEHFNMTYHEYCFDISKDFDANKYDHELLYLRKLRPSTTIGKFKIRSIDTYSIFDSHSEYYNDSYLLALYNDENLLIDANKEGVCQIADLIHAMNMGQITWGHSHYSSEGMPIEKLLPLYKSYVKYIEDVIKEQEEYDD